MKSLDQRRPYTECVGDTVASFYQKSVDGGPGEYYDAERNWISGEAAGLPEQQGKIAVAQERALEASRGTPVLDAAVAAQVGAGQTAVEERSMEDQFYDIYRNQGMPEEDARRMAQAAAGNAPRDTQEPEAVPPSVASPPEAASKPPEQAPVDPSLVLAEQLDEATTQSEVEAALDSAHVNKIAKMVKGLGAEPAKGTGAKKANIAIIVKAWQEDQSAVA